MIKLIESIMTLNFETSCEYVLLNLLYQTAYFLVHSLAVASYFFLSCL